jgi:hypothetical protein
MSPFPLKPGMGPPMESPEADAYLWGPITPFRADIEHDGPAVRFQHVSGHVTASAARVGQESNALANEVLMPGPGFEPGNSYESRS